MSITRKASKPALRVTAEDLAATLDQKNSIIAALQAELDKLRANQERIDRVKDELAKARFRHECLLRDQVPFDLFRKPHPLTERKDSNFQSETFKNCASNRNTSTRSGASELRDSRRPGSRPRN